MNYVGIDIGGTNLKAGLVNEQGLVLAENKMKIANISDPDDLTQTLVDLTRDLARTASIPVEQIASVGVGVPGAVEIRSGSILYTCNLPLRNVPVRRLFRKQLNLPLYIENDANCAALAEYYAGAGRGSKRFVTITLGTGVGAGVIHNGKIFHGGNGMAGEVGHMVIVYHGEPCPCGRQGCWEQYASANALKRMTAQALEAHPDSILRQVVDENGGRVSGQSAFIAARRGDSVGREVCEKYVEYLGIGIVNVINIFQPDTLAIGGGVSNESEEQLLFPLRRIVERESIPCNRDKMTRVVTAELGTRAGIIGAAFLGKKRRVI
jgi:glucokinase